MVIRLSRSLVGEEEKAALARVIDSGHLGMGEEVRLFEHELGQWLGVDRHVICVSTGTAALQLAIAAVDIGPGHEVLVPTITYVASFQAVYATGARPVACDVRSEDLYIDTESMRRKLTSRTRAIMPVHYASGTRGLDEVYSFAQKHGLRVIEDAAHAFGNIYKGARLGAAGDIVCFSFDGIKNITSGEGGAIVTSDGRVASLARDARLLGVERDTDARFAGRRSWNFDVARPGYRYHMSNVMAAIGREQLRKVEIFCSRRRQLAERYRRELSSLNAIAILKLNWQDIVPHIFVIKVLAGDRERLVSALKAKDIECGFHYQPNHMLSLFASQDSFPVADEAATQIVTLPMHAGLTDDEQSLVIEAVRSYAGSA